MDSLHTQLLPTSTGNALGTRRTNLEMLKNHDEKLNYTNGESDTGTKAEALAVHCSGGCADLGQDPHTDFSVAAQQAADSLPCIMGNIISQISSWKPPW